MTAKITRAAVLEGIQEMRVGQKERKFIQTVELQLGLKDYDPQKDKRFVGTVRLPNYARPNLKICLIADEKHRVEAVKDMDNLGNFTVTTLDELKKFNKDKKLVKKWAKQFDLLLASDTCLKRVPVVVGPILNRIQMFPTVVAKTQPLVTTINDTRASVKFQLRKVTCMGCAVGKADMNDEELQANIMMSLNFLVSMLKKGWHNLKSVYIKTSMGKSVQLL